MSLTHSAPAINNNQTIFRPVVESNYTILPNELYNAKLFFPELTRTAVDVLLHLFSKPDNWKINPKAIGNAIGCCARTVSTALANLIKHGFASYVRFSNGTTRWTIKIPDKHPAKLDISPQCKNPHVDKPHEQNCSVLETKEKTQITKTPQTAAPITEKIKDVVVVVAKEVEQPTNLPLPAQLNDSEKQSAIKALAKISDHALQVAILGIYAKALTDNIIRTSKVGYLIRLVERAIAGTLDIPAKVVSEEEKKAIRTAKIRDIVQRNQAAILKELELKGFVSFKGMGIFTKDELKPYLVGL